MELDQPPASWQWELTGRMQKIFSALHVQAVQLLTPCPGKPRRAMWNSGNISQAFKKFSVSNNLYNSRTEWFLLEAINALAKENIRQRMIIHQLKAKSEGYKAYLVDVLKFSFPIAWGQKRAKDQAQDFSILQSYRRCRILKLGISSLLRSGSY